MTVDPTLRALLDRSDARIIAFDAQGGNTVAVPAGWGQVAASAMPGGGPLDQVDPESHGRAVAAFERAKRQGRASTTITMVGGQGRHRLEIFDLTEIYRCFVAVAIPDMTARRTGDVVATLAPHQTTYELNATGVILSVGPEFTRMFGWCEEEVVGRSSLDFIHPDDHENGIVHWIELLEQPLGQVRLRQRVQTKAGGWVWCELTETNLLGQPDTDCVTSEIVDVSREMAAQAALQEREQLFDRLNQALPTGVLQLSAGGDVVVQNQRWIELIGPTDGDGLMGLLEHVADPEAMELTVEEALATGEDADLPVTFDGTGSCRFGELHVRPLQQDGVTTGLLMTLDDVTKLQTYQLELAEQARRDALTGAYNRLGIEELIEERLSDGSVDERGLTVLFVDLDRFKVVNDHFGHLLGDHVLKAVVCCIQDHLRPDDQVGRIGGDEFLVILGPGSTLDDATRLVERITVALPTVAEQFDEPLVVGASIGVADGSRGDSFDSILKRADADMYRAKRGQADQAARAD